jgi:acyl carrier protein
MAAIQCTQALVIEILETRVGIPSDTPGIDTATWSELGVESLGLSEASSILSLTLEVEIPHEEALLTQNIQELVDLANRQLLSNTQL